MIVASIAGGVLAAIIIGAEVLGRVIDERDLRLRAWLLELDTRAANASKAPRCLP